MGRRLTAAIRLPAHAVERLQDAATVRGMTLPALLSALMLAIAEDGLVGAVLDDGSQQ